MRLKYLFIFLLFSLSLFSQNCIQKIIYDSDAVFLSSEIIKKFSIRKVNFIENIDTTYFHNYPLPSSVKFLLHTSIYNPEGLPEHYEWSFSDKNNIIMNEKDSSYGRFFIINEYDIKYSDNKISTINISDATLENYINYQYSDDSLIVEIGIFNTDKTIKKNRKSYGNNYCNIIYRNTGIKNLYFPDIRIIPLNKVKPEELYINGIPANSFLKEKFEQNRFIMEIRPGLYIFFELST